MLKKDIRSLYLSKRQEVSKINILAFNKAITNQLNNFNWINYKTISIYLPISNLKEINTFKILTYFQKNHPHIKIAVPKTNFKILILEHLEYTHQTTLLENKYQIPEPQSGNVIIPNNIDVVFVPLLAFDNLGFRVGYGKGVYDRFLASCRIDVVKIGLSFFDSINSIDDVNEFDIPLNYCITPNKIYSF